MAVHQQHVGLDLIAADLDVLWECGEYPDAPSAVQAARRLEMQRAAEQLVDERERLRVLHDAVALTDDPENLLGVLTHGREIARDLSGGRSCPPSRCIVVVQRDRLLRHAPAEP